MAAGRLNLHLSGTWERLPLDKHTAGFKGSRREGNTVVYCLDDTSAQTLEIKNTWVVIRNRAAGSISIMVGRSEVYIGAGRSVAIKGCAYSFKSGTVYIYRERSFIKCARE